MPVLRSNDLTQILYVFIHSASEAGIPSEDGVLHKLGILTTGVIAGGGADPVSHQAVASIKPYIMVLQPQPANFLTRALTALCYAPQPRGMDRSVRHSAE